MSVLYLLNLMLFPLTFIFSAIYFTTYFRLNWLNPLTAVAGAYLPALLVTSFTGPVVVLEGGLFNPYFQYALLVNNVHEALTTFALIYIVRFFSRNRGMIRLVDRVARSGGLVKPRRMRFAAYAFLGLYCVFFVLLAQHSFSVLQWIASPRTGYQGHREGAGQWYALAITALSVSLVLMAVYQSSTRKLLAFSPLYVFFIYLLGSKGLIVNFVVFIVIMLAVRQYRHLGLLTLMTGIGAAVLVISNLVSSLRGADLESLASYSDGYTNAAHYYQKYLSGDLPLLNGQVFASGFWGLVPRALFPNKPYVYGAILITEIFYPGAAERTNTPAFSTIPYFADFGWIGVLFSALFSPANISTAFLYLLVLPRLRLLNQEKEEKHFLFLTYAFLFLAAPSFLAFFEFPNSTILFAVIAVIMNIFNRLSVQRSASGTEGYAEEKAMLS